MKLHVVKLLTLVVACSTWPTALHAQSAKTAVSTPILPPTAKTGNVIRDPLTGKWYRQQLVSVTLPITKWESKPVTQTVYEAKPVVAHVAKHKPMFVPRTENVWEVRTRGRFNPFRQTSYVYKVRPETRWVQGTDIEMVPVTTQQWTARHQTTFVTQPVQTMETVQRLVQTEIPPPAGSTALLKQANIGTPGVAMQPRALINLPLFARRSRRTWAQPAVNTVAPVGSPPAAGGTSVARTAYNPARDSYQSGLSATVLR